MPLDSIYSEYRRYKKLADMAIAQTRDEDLHRPLEAEGNTIEVLVCHLSGNFISRFTDYLISDGEKPWRNRDGEFLRQELSRKELLLYWEEGWGVLFGSLDQLTKQNLKQIVSIRGVPHTVVQSLNRSLGHTAYHVGQIALIARCHAGSEWKSLSIPLGQSKTYNKNPVKERVP